MTIDTPAKVGDRIRIIDTEPGLSYGHYVVGDEAEVVNAHDDGDVVVRWLTNLGGVEDEDGRVRYVLRREYEVITPEAAASEPTFKPGDRVRVADDYRSCYIAAGDTATVETAGPDEYGHVRIIMDNPKQPGQKWAYVDAKAMTLLANEQPQPIAPAIKPGDRVRAMDDVDFDADECVRPGDTGTVQEYDSTDDTYFVAWDNPLRGGPGSNWWIDAVNVQLAADTAEPTEADVAAVQDALNTPRGVGGLAALFGPFDFGEDPGDEQDDAQERAFFGDTELHFDDPTKPEPGYVFRVPPRFRITVTIEADSAEAYKAALTALGEGV